jgi:hypothetical protein
MSPSANTISRWIGALGLALALAACGKSGTTTGNSVAMKDLEVVDGTTTDAMTDLDGVRTEGTAMAPMQGGNSVAASPLTTQAANGTGGKVPEAKADGAEVVSDQ